MSDGQRDLFTPDERDTAASGIALARATLAGHRTELPPEVVDETDEALASVEANSLGWVTETALPFIRDYLEGHAELFVDDLWSAGLPEPHDRKALGPAIRKASTAGWIEQTGDFRPSASSHGLPKPTWRSLIFRGER